MAPPYFQPRQHPQLVALMKRILERMQFDLLDALGMAITVHDKAHDDQPSVIASLGIGADFAAAQLSGVGGPVPDALAYQVPVLSLDLWTDDRWPELTLATMRDLAPQHDSIWEQVHGAAAVPGVWADDATVVVCCTLSQPASAATVASLINYEQLVSAALITTAAENASAIADIITVLAVPRRHRTGQGRADGFGALRRRTRVANAAACQPGVQRETEGAGGGARRAHQRRACGAAGHGNADHAGRAHA